MPNGLWLKWPVGQGRRGVKRSRGSGGVLSIVAFVLLLATAFLPTFPTTSRLSAVLVYRATGYVLACLPYTKFKLTAYALVQTQGLSSYFFWFRSNSGTKPGVSKGKGENKGFSVVGKSC